MVDVTQSEAFQRWFNGSHVVDADGKPLLMYHGTTGNIEAFDHAYTTAIDPDAPFNGFWFSNETSTSPAFRNPTNILPVYLSIKNPAPWQVWRKVNKEVRDDWANGIENDRSRSTHDEVRHRLVDMGYDGILFSGVPTIDSEALARDGRVDFRDVAGRKAWLQNDERDGVTWGEQEEDVTNVQGVLIKADGSRSEIRHVTVPVLAQLVFDDANKANLDDFDFKKLVGIITFANGDRIETKAVTTKTKYQGWIPTGEKEKSVGYYTNAIGHVTDYSDLADFLSSHETVWVCFSPHQIKSKFNRGTWNARSPNISESMRGLINLVSGLGD